jgi:PAS domain S-box-containing protein
MKIKPTYDELERRVQELERKVSEQKYSQEPLRQDENIFERLYEQAPLGYQSLDEKGHFIVVNQAWLDTLGYTKEEIIGKSFADFLHPGWRDHFKENFPRFKAIGEILGVEFEMVKKNGDLILVSFTGKISRDKKGDFQQTHCIFYDITEHRLTEEALREKNQLLHNIINTTSDLISVTDMEGNFKFIGPSFSNLGYDLDSLVGRNVMEFVHPDDYQDIATAFTDFLANREDGRKVEYRYRQADGEYLWLETVGQSILDDAGNPKEILFTSRDFTARKCAEGELKRIEWMLSMKPVTNKQAQTVAHDQGYGDLTDLNRDGIILKSIGHERLQSFADEYLDLLGTSSAIYEVNGDYAFGIFSSGWCRMMDCASRKLCGTPDNFEALESGRWLCHESCWTSCSQKAIAQGTPVDIECNGGIRLYGVPIFADGKVVGVINCGYGDPPTDPVKLRQLADIYRVDYDDLVREADAYDSRPPYIIELAKKRLHATALLIGSIIETKQAETALRESEEKYRVLFNTFPLGIAITDPAGNIVESNARAAALLGISQDEQEARRIDGEQWRLIRPDGTSMPAEEYAGVRALREKRPVKNVEMGIVKPDAAIAWINVTAAPLLLENYGLVITYNDITDRKEAEDALKNREYLLNKVFDVLPIGLWFADENGKLIRGNPAGVKIWGAEPTVPTEQYGVFKARRLPSGEEIAPDDWALAHTIREGVTIVDELLEIDSFDGKKKTILNYTAPVLDDLGNIQGAIVVNQDITEREQLHTQLRQAQKMESIGRLAGGVAHDFNNMLSVILGHTEMALEETDLAAPLYASLQAVQHAAERSAALTRQLLAFARKQTVAPKIIDLNETVEGMLKMLRRLIGEDVDLLWKPGRSIRPVKIDPSQIDQLLANLCVNARDAIAGVGKVTIETDTKIFDDAYCADHLGFLPGEYVLLEVSDDGCGMDKKTLSHIFEPFFTTKEQSKGTGLGLASVFGMVRQNNGFINVYSEPGRGTTFKIYLPAYAVQSDEVVEKVPDLPTEHGNETILLVEDESAILQMTTRMLERLGYNVVAAATPGEAIRLAHEYRGRINLLMTDVVMPEMNGRELAGNLLSHYPDLKRLFMSGYTANVIAHHGVLDQGVHFIQKPFSKKELAGKLREALEG